MFLNKRASLRAVVGALAVVSTMGCKVFDGTLTVERDLTLKAGKKGKETVVVPAGRHEAKIDVDKKKFTLIVEGLGAREERPERPTRPGRGGRTEREERSKDLKVEFAIPKGTKIPENSGRIRLEAKDVKQNYDVDGQIETDIQDSPEMWGRESCSVVVQFRECYVNENRERVCHYVDRTYYGDREIRYFNRRITKDLDVNLLALGTGEVAAGFSGRNVATQQIVTYRGECYIPGGIGGGIIIRR